VVRFDLEVSQSSYCAYSHFSRMLERTGTDWNIAVYETYFDDSGTSSTSDMAIAACYVSTEGGWRRFVKEWDAARYEEGFDYFHMSAFRAPRTQGEKPWCDWDDAKKDRVYKRLTSIINDNKRIGIATAVPKSAYDLVPEKIRRYYGREHYTFALRICLIEIHLWRERIRNFLPMQYFFDWETPGSLKRREITTAFEDMHPDYQKMFGLDTGGFGFQKKECFKPLQAADILAWQTHKYIPKIYPNNETQEDVNTKMHWGFGLLRRGQDLRMQFLTPSTIDAWVERLLKFEAEHGVIP
jgi:hypothetical protein